VTNLEPEHTPRVRESLLHNNIRAAVATIFGSDGAA
jgi:hypothetical protein